MMVKAIGLEKQKTIEHTALSFTTLLITFKHRESHAVQKTA
jgi:hypothetical protein